MDGNNGSEPFLSIRDAVMEIRSDVKDMRTQIDRIDREGSIGTKQELEDHEGRLRLLETAGFRLSGAMASAGIALSAIAGIAGITLAATALVFH